MLKLDRLLTLVYALSDASNGLTLDEMAACVNVHRRTAERMRDVIETHFDLERTADDRQTRFFIRDSLRRVFTRPTAEEVAALEAEVDGLRKAGRDARAAQPPLISLRRSTRRWRERYDWKGHRLPDAI